MDEIQIAVGVSGGFRLMLRDEQIAQVRSLQLARMMKSRGDEEIDRFREAAHRQAQVARINAWRETA